MTSKYSFDHLNCLVEVGKDLSKNSTMGLKAYGDLITVYDLESLKEIVQSLASYQLIGWGANTLLDFESATPYLLLSFEYDQKQCDKFQDEYLFPASISLAKLVKMASVLGLNGWEVLTGIPGSLGGSIFGNAGTKFGEIANIVKKVWVLTKDGREKIIEGKDLKFSYRKNHFLQKGDIIYQASLVHFGHCEQVSTKIKDYLKHRNKTQPLKEKTCGCIFKNAKLEGETCPAGKSIDIIGLKGYSIGPAKVSELHGNFIINSGGAQKEDVLKLIKHVHKRLLKETGINFETEVNL